MGSRTILITSIGSLVGRNLLDALDGRRDHLIVLGTNNVPAAESCFRCDKTWIVPPAIEVRAYDKALSELIDREHPDLVIPGRDDDILALARMREARPDLAPRLMVGSLEAATTMDDKVRSYEFAENAGLPFAPTVATGSRVDGQSAAHDAPLRTRAARLVETYGYPLIAKPRRGNGSRGVRMLTSKSQLERILSRDDYALQPMLGAAEMALSFDEGIPLFWSMPEESLYVAEGLVSPRGEVGPLFVGTMHMVAGKCERLHRLWDSGFMALARDYFLALAKHGWRGPINLQLKARTRGPASPEQARNHESPPDEVLRHQLLAIEINGRYGGATTARTLLGFDEVGIGINQWLGDGTLPLRHESETVFAFVEKRLADAPVARDALEALERTGHWARDARQRQGDVPLAARGARPDG